MAPNTLTIASILRALAVNYDGPVSERELMDRVLEQRPSHAKDPYAAIREKLRWQGPLLGWVRLGGGSLLPLSVVLRNLRFRCIPDTHEVQLGLLDLSKLAPFVRMPDDIRALEDASGTRVPVSVVPLRVTNDNWNADTLHPRLELDAWYRATGFVPGDSIVVTVVESQPLVLRLQCEPAHAFRKAAVERQDAELRDAIWHQVERSQSTSLHSAEVVLPAFARAAWRTDYPGMPWQHLVQRDGRMRLIDGVYVAQNDLSTDDDEQTSGIELETAGRGIDFLQIEAVLLREIETLQEQIRASRQCDIEVGLWDGQTPEVSALQADQGSFSNSHDAGERADKINEYERDDDTEEWNESDWEDVLGDDGGLEWEDGVERDPDLIAASQRLLAALTPDEVERLQNARPEEAELLIASKLNHLLVHEPSLFVTIARPGVPGEYVAPTYLDTIDAELDEAETWEDDPWEEDAADEVWDDEIWNEIIDPDDRSFARSDTLARQFYDFLRESGKSESTARSRANDLWVYADFLARTYSRSLDQGDYATLDECLFFFYPHNVMPRSARSVKNLCTSLKQFYSFLKSRSVISDDAFAQALWRRRDQAAQVVDIYNRISSDWPNADVLAERLFAPYVP